MDKKTPIADLDIVDNDGEYIPKTEFGRRLMAIRREYILSGGKLLNDEELEAEIRERCGDIDDETDLDLVDHKEEYIPKTEFGRELMAIRREYILSGGELLNDEEVETEIRELRGGIDDKTK